MFLGTIVGTVWATKKVPQVQNLRFLLVRPKGLEAEPNTNLVIVADVLGAGVGEEVICAYGHAARQAIQPENPEELAIEAAVIGIVDSIDYAEATLKKRAPGVKKKVIKLTDEQWPR